METDELPVVDPDVDFRQVPSLHQKRTIAFVNHFIMKTVSFLNNFAASCESRLMDLEHKLEKVEASLLILESQLSSIPWLDDKKVPLNESSETASNNNHDDIKTLNLPEVKTNNQNKIDKADDNDSHSVIGPKACEDPRFVRFFKMIQFGVPLPAVKLKMEIEGLDSTVLENPNSVVPGFETSNNLSEIS